MILKVGWDSILPFLEVVLFTDGKTMFAASRAMNEETHGAIKSAKKVFSNLNVFVYPTRFVNSDFTSNRLSAPRLQVWLNPQYLIVRSKIDVVSLVQK